MLLVLYLDPSTKIVFTWTRIKIEVFIQRYHRFKRGFSLDLYIYK